MNVLYVNKYDQETRTLFQDDELGSKQNFYSKKYQSSMLDDEQLEYMSFILEEAHELKKPVLITYAGRYSPLQFYGRIFKIHPYEGWLVIANGEIRKKISYRKLIDVDLAVI